MKRFLFFVLLLNNALMVNSQTVIPLYKDSIPNSKPTANIESATYEGENKILIVHHVSQPSLTVFLAPKDKANGKAVIICPGGGYSILAASHEGYDVAKRFNEMGVTAFVLKYRIPNDNTMINKEIGPLQDAQCAIQMVRERAKEWNIKTDRIGIMGFSAGGHLASTAGTHFDRPVIENKSNISLRPDFMILIYPVISFDDSIGHIGSRDNLLGKNPSEEKIKYYSNELQVNSSTPPSFLVHAENDEAVKVQNSLYFFEALQKNKVPAELHIYPKGGHGFGMHNPTTKEDWVLCLKGWLDGM